MEILKMRFSGCVMLLVLITGCSQNTPGPALSAGEQAFQACIACHSPANENRPTGPNLHGIIGRPAASSEGYFYSEGLRQSGIVWDVATLDAFITNPSVRVPGTFMIAGVPDPQGRAAIIEYLQTLR
jgi:cytochrome c